LAYTEQQVDSKREQQVGSFAHSESCKLAQRGGRRSASWLIQTAASRLIEGAAGWLLGLHRAASRLKEGAAG
jgi:hypothetical protein